MPDVLYFLLGIELSAGISEPQKHFPQVEQVNMEHATNHDHIFRAHDMTHK
jgi:hypothetical protein